MKLTCSWNCGIHTYDVIGPHIYMWSVAALACNSRVVVTDHMASTAQNRHRLAFYQKGLSTPVLLIWELAVDSMPLHF
jgi:hypothetical protein